MWRRFGKWGILVFAIFLITPIGLALESDIYFVTSEVSISEVIEEVEIVGKTEQLDLIELKLPLHVGELDVMFNAEELECSLKEEIGYTLLRCPVDSHTGSYFLKLTYVYEPLSLDGRLFFKTLHEPQTKSFVSVVKLGKDYQVPADDIGSLVSPQPSNSYLERGRQVFVWKLEDVDGFEATIVANSLVSYRNIFLGAFVFVALAILLVFFKIRRKKVSPKLIESEQVIVDVLKQQKKSIKQKELQRKTGFSKARLSRILNNLEERGVISKTPWGRTNLIELKRK
jgi:predicted transcriptional regulator